MLRMRLVLDAARLGGALLLVRPDDELLAGATQGRRRVVAVPRGLQRRGCDLTRYHRGHPAVHLWLYLCLQSVLHKVTSLDCAHRAGLHDSIRRLRPSLRLRSTIDGHPANDLAVARVFLVYLKPTGAVFGGDADFGSHVVGTRVQ